MLLSIYEKNIFYKTLIHTCLRITSSLSVSMLLIFFMRIVRRFNNLSVISRL